MEMKMSASIQSATGTPTAGTAKRPGKTVKLKTFLQSKGTLDSPSKRKSLQQLQPSAEDDCKLVGKDGFVRTVAQKPRTPKRKRDGDEEKPAKRQAKLIAKPTKKFSVYKDVTLDDDDDDGSTSREEGVTAKQKTPEEEAYELMVQEEIPEKYWEGLAEERRVALEGTLKENEQLHTQVGELKEENARLKVTADQAVYLAEVVQDLLGEKEDGETADARLSEEEIGEADGGNRGPDGKRKGADGEGVEERGASNSEGLNGKERLTSRDGNAGQADGGPEASDWR